MSKANKFFLILGVGLSIALLLTLPSSAEHVQAAGICGTGTWTSGNLEIHHINIGQGDSALIVGPTGKSLLLDAGETSWNSSAKARIIGPYIEGVLGCTSLDYVVISHFHLDHIGYVGYGGLWHLVETQGFTVGTTLVRDYNTYLGSTSGTFTNWKTYLEGVGQPKLHPATAIEGTSQVDLGAGVTFNIVAVDGNGAIIAGDFHGESNPPSENDYSIGAVLSYGDFDEWIGGDLDGEYEIGGFGYTYHDIELSVAPEVDDVDVYKANHHGSSHSSSATFINQLDPEVSILSLGDGNTYGHPPQSTMDRLLATSAVYMTQRGDTNTNIGSAIVAGNIVIKTSDGSAYTVNGTPFTATEPTRTDMDGDGYFAEADPADSDSGLVPAPNGGCGPLYQTCSVSCQATAGQLLINEFLPSPSSGSEWVELYNTTGSTINIGYCYIDDIVAGSPAYQIPASTLIPAHGFWTLDQITYFNNAGDDVRFLKEDASTVLDSYTYGSTGSDLSRYRFPDGGSWAGSPTASTTKGQSNTIPFYPIVSSSVRVDENPTDLNSVNFTVTFSKAVTGVNTSAPFNDFTLTNTGVTGAYISAVSGSGAIYTVTVNTGSGDGTIRLNIVDDDSIRDASNHPLGGNGTGNGNFIIGETYTIDKPPPNTDVYIGGTLRDSYYVGPEQSVSGRYGINGGPVLVRSTSGLPIFSSQRAIFGSSFNSIVGYPADQLTTDYWFTSYDDLGMITYLVIGNPHPTLTAQVDVYIGGIKRNATPYSIAPGQRIFPRYAINAGPVHVVSTNGVNIFTSERTKFGPSFNEVMGYPGDQLTTDYWFTSYDDVGMITYLVIGNPHATLTAQVDVYIAGVKKNTVPYSIAPGQRVFPRYAINGGPVHVVSTNGVDIFTSERSKFGESFNEVMGYPGDQLTTDYWFTSYDDTSMITYLVIGNPHATLTAQVDVYIAGVKKNLTPYVIAPGQRVFPRYAIDQGPVQVISTNGVDIFTSERTKYLSSFNEILGLANDQLTTDYWFTAYDDVGMDTELVISAP